jgi:hypothetical protein
MEQKQASEENPKPPGMPRASGFLKYYRKSAEGGDYKAEPLGVRIMGHVMTGGQNRAHYEDQTTNHHECILD